MKSTKLLTSSLMAALLAAPFAPVNAAEFGGADVTANAGLVSDYYFRGQNLGDAGLFAGADVEVGGFYAGTWWIDDSSGGNDGLETDFYLGYGLEINENITLGLGYTRYEYTYTSDFEHEINLTASFGPVALEYSTGEDDDKDSPTTDYNFYAVSWSGEVFGATLGSFENDDNKDSYDYFELSASKELQGLDVSVHLGKTTNVELSGAEAASGDGYMFLNISKSFDL